jgi:hypothetical protein
MSLLVRILWEPWRATAREFVGALDAVLNAGTNRVRAFVLVLAATLTAWFLYVPAHELLHALGCIAAGGSVQELQIQPLYGGALLERVFPFVVAGGDYAGRLTGFDTGGSDLVHFVTVLAPFLLTVAVAVPLLRLARRTGGAVPLGAGLVLAVAPLVSLAGDGYEMGSLVVGALLQVLGAPPGGVQALRHDDLFALLAEFPVRFPDRRPAWSAAVVVSAAMGVLLCGLLLEASHRWADFLAARRTGRDGARPAR